jgi:hypothetical protein
VFTVNLADGLGVGVIAEAGTLFDAADCSVAAGNVVTCTDATADAENHTTGTITIPTTAGVSAITAPTACSYDDADAATGPAVCTINAGAVGIISATVNPVSATNLIGQSETFTWTLPAQFTCLLDLNADGLVQCAGTDIVFDPGTTGATIGAAVIRTPTALTTTVAITISGATAAGTATIGLKLQLGDGHATCPIGPSAGTVTATKIFTTLAEAGAHIQHADVDNATEDVAGDSPSTSMQPAAQPPVRTP